MYNLLALDLDGTVLDSKGKISQQLRDTITSIRRGSAHVILVTGRHHTAAKPYYYELGLDTPIICCNGTYEYDYQSKKVIQHNAIPKDLAVNFLDLANSYQLNLVVYIAEAMLYSNSRPIEYMERLKLWSEQYQGHLKPNIQQIDDFHNEIFNTNHVWKFVVEGSQEALKDFMLEALIQEHFSAERSWVNRFDFAMKGNVKGTALERYAKRIGVSSDKVVAVGDNFNDLSMLQYAGLGIAMKNSADAVKEHAQLITEYDHDSEAGLAELLSSIFEHQ